MASRTKHPLSIAIVDLDRFKSVNDISGHQMGDICFAQSRFSHFSQTARIRFGGPVGNGEEFARSISRYEPEVRKGPSGAEQSADGAAPIHLLNSGGAAALK